MASLSVNRLKLFSATAMQPSLFQKITTLNTFYKHRVELHLQEYSESHLQIVLEDTLKVYPRTMQLSKENLFKLEAIISKIPSHAPKHTVTSLDLTIYFPSSFFIWLQ